MIIGIAQWVQHAAIVRQGVDKAWPAVGAFCFRQQMIQAFERDLAALRVPADVHRLGEAIDLAGLDENPSRVRG
jgi:hypothetical protein